MEDIKLSLLISDALRLDEQYIIRLAHSSSQYYRTYSISKKNGQRRTICHPSPELKTLQYWISRHILTLFPVSTSSFAYKKGISIKDHAKCHLVSKFILHLDIKDFFENIKQSHLENLIVRNLETFSYIKQLFGANNQYSGQNKQLLQNICLRSEKICIGAVSSPSVSNAIMYEFDQWADEYCAKKSLKYSRYADDMYISSDTYIGSLILNDFETQLNKNGFTLNQSKTRYMSRKGQRRVTGLIITPDQQIRIGLKLRSEIRSMVYKKLAKQEGDSARILGYLAYLQQIEPDTYNKIITKYAKFGDIIEILKQS